MSFRFHLLSDLHLEYLFPDPQVFESDPDTAAGKVLQLVSTHPVLRYIYDRTTSTPPPVEYLALLGDIGLAGETGHFKHQLEPFLRACCAKYKHVFFVFGNHSCYRSNVSAATKNLTGLGEEIPNFHLLDKTVFDVAETDVRILGCTLWTHCAPGARNALNDFRQIKKFGVDDMWNIHDDHVAWLMEELKKAEEDKKRCVIFTHHCPIFKGIALPNDEKELAFEDEFKITGTDLLPKVFNRKAFPSLVAWAWGHSHWNFEPHFINEKDASDDDKGIKVMCNQEGYPGNEEPYRLLKGYMEAAIDKVFEV